MSERYVPSEVQPTLSAPALFQSLHQDAGALRVQLVGATVVFDGWLTYRVTDEGDRMKTAKDLAGLANTPICQVENSTYLEWFVKESANVRKAHELEHWAVVTANEVIDVIGLEKPTWAKSDA